MYWGMGVKVNFKGHTADSGFSGLDSPTLLPCNSFPGNVDQLSWHIRLLQWTQDSELAWHRSKVLYQVRPLEVM